MVFKSKIALTGQAILFIGCDSRMVLTDGQSCGGGIAGGLGSCAEFKLIGRESCVEF